MSKKTKNLRPQSPTINDSLLTRESWKIFQVIAEFVEGYERLVHIKPSVSIFGSARIKTDSPHYKLAEEIAKKLSDSGFSIVTGGGPGIMEAANKGAYNGKSLSIGLNIVLPEEEPQNKFQDICLRFRHFFTRKIMFVKYAAAYVVLPGGYGTLDELAEILALVQTKKTRKIPIVLLEKSHWEGLIEWFRNTLMPGDFISKDDLDHFYVAENADDAAEYIIQHYKAHNIEPSDSETDLMRGL